MKSLMRLWSILLAELGEQCGTRTTNDRNTAISRFEDEGLSFLTITLPSFCSDLQKGLSDEKVDRRLFSGFKRKGELPLFLGGFLDLIFDRETGELLDIPDSFAIFSIRQLTLFYGKISIPCSDTRVRGAISGYMKCEKEIKENDARRSLTDYETFHRASILLFGDLFSRVDHAIYNGEHIPKHGPGATADKLRGNSKWNQTEWPLRLEEYFPALEFITPGVKYFPLLEHVDFLEPGAERPVRVITVPKTLKAPRIIAIEPAAMQYAQQSILELLVDHVARDDLLNQMIGFTDQTPNQRLARQGSISGDLATLDLSEASDRVSNQLIRRLLMNHPHLASAVDSCRSRKADVPGNGVIRLSKFASMGSALCFPFEAIVFLTSCFVGISKWLNRPMSRALIREYRDQVRVFGDDIIVPVDSVSHVVATLEAFGFRVNASKSFWTGGFRESCGKDYFRGNDVSVVRIRQTIPTRRAHVSEVISMVSSRNQLYKLGLWKTCQWIDQRLESILGYYPVVESTSPVLGRESIFPYKTGKMDPDTHSPLVKGYVVRSRIPTSTLDGESALLKWFLKRGSEPYPIDHLERAGRPDAVDIKLRWASPF